MSTAPMVRPLDLICVRALRTNLRLDLYTSAHLRSPVSSIMHNIAMRCCAAFIAVPGQLDMDIPSLGVDYYTGNLHKWCYVPPAVAFLWVASNDHLQAMHYPVISHAYNQGLLEESGFVGTRDYSMYCAVPAAIDFHRSFATATSGAGGAGGGESVPEYTHRLITEAAMMLTAAWGTKLGQPVDDSCGSMMMVGLPPVRSAMHHDV